MPKISKTIFNKNIELEQKLIKYEKFNEAKLYTLCQRSFKCKESGQIEHKDIFKLSIKIYTSFPW